MPGTSGLLARHAEMTVAEALADTRVVTVNGARQALLPLARRSTIRPALSSIRA